MTLEETISKNIQLFKHMQKNDLKDFVALDIDYNFTSNNKTNLELLKKDLENEFSIKLVYLKKIDFFKNEYELSVVLNNIIITEELFIFLAVYLHKKCEAYNCILGDNGALIDNTRPYDFDKLDLAVKNNGYNYNDEKLLYKAYEIFFLLSHKYKSAEIYYNLGCLNYDFDLLQKALKYFDAAIETQPQIPIPYLNRGVLFYDIGEYEKAIKDYMFVIEKEPNEPNAL